jgi:hypothetical protein
MVPKNTSPTSETAEEFWNNSLWCTWVDRKTAGFIRSVAVSIYQAADGEQRAEELRSLMNDECAQDLDLQTPNPEAYEIPNQRPGEHVFVLTYVEVWWQ